MKRTSLTVILALSMLGAPMPVQAANGMTDMMSLMMEMFLWMMRGGGGGGGGFNPYAMGGPGGNNPYSMAGLGGIGNPMLASSMLGNPMLSNSLSGYPSGWGNTLPYAAQGLYQPFAYPGQGPYSSPYNSLYGSSYSSPHYGNNYPGSYGYQPYYRQGSTNPFYLNQYSRFTVECGQNGVVLETINYRGNITNTNHTTIGGFTNNDVTEFCLCIGLAADF